MLFLIIMIYHQIMTRKEMHLTRMMSIIVITFLVLNMPRCIIGLFELTRFASMEQAPASSGEISMPKVIKKYGARE